jgi:hypothetical protein
MNQEASNAHVSPIAKIRPPSPRESLIPSPSPLGQGRGGQGGEGRMPQHEENLSPTRPPKGDNQLP